MNPARPRWRTRLLLAILGGLATAVAAIPAAGAPAAATTTWVASGGVSTTTVGADLGGLDLNTYCRSLGFDHVTSIDPSPSGWRCVTAGGEQVSLSILDACRFQFSDLVAAGFTLTTSNSGTAGSWRCHSTVLTAQSFGGLDLARYCREGLGFTGVTLEEKTVSGWRCVASDGTKVPFSMHASCQWQNADAVSRGWAIVSVFGRIGDWAGIRCLGLRNS